MVSAVSVSVRVLVVRFPAVSFQKCFVSRFPFRFRSTLENQGRLLSKSEEQYAKFVSALLGVASERSVRGAKLLKVSGNLGVLKFFFPPLVFCFKAYF